MKKGCLSTLVIWAIAAGAYWIVLRSRVQPPMSTYVPLGAGFLIAIAIAQLRAAVTWAGRARRIGGQSMSMPGERPKEGEAVALTGRIRAIGPVLAAPFSGKPAVLYSYDIEDLRPAARGRNSQPPSVYSGFALTPSVVDTPVGGVRLLGFPMPDKSDTVPVDGAAERENAAAWIARTPFHDLGPLQVTAIYREMKDILTDDDGEVRKDWRMRDDPDLEGKRLREYVVAPGEQVCIMGRYSAEKGAIVPDFAGGNVVQLLRGDPEKVRRTMWWKAVGSVIGAIVIAAIANGVVYAFVLHPSGLR